MTDALNAKTFDIADLFTGKAYPKEAVEVYLDEDVAYQINKNNKDIAKAVEADDEATLKTLYTRHEELMKKGAASKVTFHLTGVSRADRQAVIDATLEEYPLEFNFLGRPTPNPKADDAHANRRWALHIERIERPDGSVRTTPTPDEVAVFRNNAPDLAIEQIEKGIESLTEGANGGFETLAQETSFLSQP